MWPKQPADPRSKAGRARRRRQRLPKELRRKALSEQRRYCLYCFHTIADKGARCDHCQRLDTPSDHRLFWNHHPKLIKIHSYIRFVSVAIAAVMAFYLVDYTRDPRTTLWLGFPFGLLLIVELTNAKLLRHGWNFRADIVWPLMWIFWIPLNAFWVLARYEDPLLPSVILLASILMLPVTFLAIRRLSAWKERLMQEGPQT